MRISRPARHQMRKDCRTSGKAALQSVLQVQQAQIIFAPLAHHDLGFECLMVGVKALRLTHQLPLERFGKGGNPDRSVGGGRPKACGRQIAKRLTNACASLSQQHIGFALARTRRENLRCCLRKIPLPLARFGRTADQRCEPFLHGVSRKRYHAGRRAGRRLFPFGQATEQPAFGALGLFKLRQDQICPRPAQPHECLCRIPSAFAFGPCRIAQHRQQTARRHKQERRNLLIGCRCSQAQGFGQTFGRGHSKPRGIYKSV